MNGPTNIERVPGLAVYEITKLTPRSVLVDSTLVMSMVLFSISSGGKINGNADEEAVGIAVAVGLGAAVGLGVGVGVEDGAHWT